MRRAVIFLAIMLAAGTGGGTGTVLSQQEQNALTTIDQVPTQAQLTTAFGSAAAADIVAIAADSGNDV